MPNYKYNQYFSQSSVATFDQILPPGAITPASGIYRCESCGFEAASILGAPLPPAQICPHHSPNWKCNHGPVRWRLVAAAIHISA
jgi:hypothetical protein